MFVQGSQGQAVKPARTISQHGGPPTALVISELLVVHSEKWARVHSHTSSSKGTMPNQNSNKYYQQLQ